MPGTVQCETRGRALSLVCLPSVYLTSPHETKSSRPSPSKFVYCKQSNTGGGDGPGTKLPRCWVYPLNAGSALLITI